jgi:hypothetical protein
MTSTVNELTQAAVMSDTLGALSTMTAIVIIVLLLVLLTHREFLRGFNSPRSEMWIRASDIAVASLLVAFGLIVVLHLISLISPM